jgi:hypothetical protein
MKLKSNSRKLFLRSLISSLVVSALVGIFVILFGDFGETEAKILLTTCSIGIYSLVGLCTSALYENKKSSFGLIGTYVSLLAFIYTLTMIWVTFPEEMIYSHLLGLFMVASFSFAHSSLILLINTNQKIIKMSKYLTVILIFIVASMLTYLIFQDFNIYKHIHIRLFFQDFFIDEELFFRLLGVFAILDALATLLTPLLKKLIKQSKIQ